MAVGEGSIVITRFVAVGVAGSDGVTVGVAVGKTVEVGSSVALGVALGGKVAVMTRALTTVSVCVAKGVAVSSGFNALAHNDGLRAK